MELTLLGTGSAMPTGRRMQAGYLLTRDDHSLLVDCGSGVLHQLCHTEPGYAGIDTILLTHHHLDHIADLLPILKARWLAGAPPVDVYGPPGTEELLSHLLERHEYLATKVEAIARDIEASVSQVGDWQIGARETTHSMQCFAYRVFDEHGDVTISGDTEADRGLVEFAGGSNVLVHDCSFPDGVNVSNHPTPSQLGTVLSGSDIECVVLTHLYPATTGRIQEMRQSIRAEYTGDVLVLDDLEQIAI